ncbi:MAG: PAS domain S-box protein, partial [Deltaproteobacteria bacterium]|nr:PAS domain S-box protein [Deltaproteobacteria bacterium]
MSAERLLEDERYRLMIERLPAGVLVHGHDGAILFANSAAARIAGVRTSAELVHRSIGDFLPPPFLKSLRNGLLGGDTLPERVRERLTRADGAVIDVEVSEIPYLSGGILCVQLSVTDARAAIEAEGAIALAESRMRELAERIPGVLWTADVDGRITSCTGGLGFAGDRRSWVGAPFEELFGG